MPDTPDILQAKQNMINFSEVSSIAKMLDCYPSKCIMKTACLYIKAEWYCVMLWNKFPKFAYVRSRLGYGSIKSVMQKIKTKMELMTNFMYSFHNMKAEAHLVAIENT